MPNGEAELPAVYHENLLCLMVQAPDVVFAYWDFSRGHLHTISGEKKLVLCLYQDRLLNHKVALPPFTHDWYFRDVQPGSAYYCELGFQGPGGTFFPLLRSNRVNTPGLSQAAEEDALAAAAIGLDFAPLTAGPGRSYKKDDLMKEMAFYMGISSS